MQDAFMMTEPKPLTTAPPGLDAPIAIGGSVQHFEAWSGISKFRQKNREISGRARVFLDILPVPEFQFEFTPDEQLSLETVFSNSPLGEGVLECGPPIGAIDCQVTRVGEVLSGYVQGQASNDDHPNAVSSALYLVINGPEVLGAPISRGNSHFCGRMTAAVGGIEVTIDRLRSKKQEPRCLYDSTHVARCVFSSELTNEQVNAVSTNLFRALSLMRGRWIGLLGPWLFDSTGKEIGFRLTITKTMRNGGAISWCHNTMRDCFEQLFPALVASFANDKRAAPLQTALHWLVEAEQCAGGVEGAIILQQAALYQSQ